MQVAGRYDTFTLQTQLAQGFGRWAALEAHLGWWQREIADRRRHRIEKRVFHPGLDGASAAHRLHTIIVVDLHTPFLHGSVFDVAGAVLDVA